MHTALLTKDRNILKESQIPAFAAEIRCLCKTWHAALMSRNGAEEDSQKVWRGQSQHTTAFCASHFLYQCKAHSVQYIWSGT